MNYPCIRPYLPSPQLATATSPFHRGVAGNPIRKPALPLLLFIPGILSSVSSVLEYQKSDIPRSRPLYTTIPRARLPYSYSLFRPSCAIRNTGGINNRQYQNLVLRCLDNILLLPPSTWKRAPYHPPHHPPYRPPPCRSSRARTRAIWTGTTQTAVAPSTPTVRLPSWLARIVSPSPPPRHITSYVKKETAADPGWKLQNSPAALQLPQNSKCRKCPPQRPKHHTTPRSLRRPLSSLLT